MRRARLAWLRHPHFVKEETFALPALGLLGELAHGPVREEMADMLSLTRRLGSCAHDVPLRDHVAFTRRSGANEFVGDEPNATSSA